MSTPESNRRAASRLHTAIDRGLMALGAFVAVGVMVPFLALLGANRANPASAVTPTPQPSTVHRRHSSPAALRHTNNALPPTDPCLRSRAGRSTRCEVGSLLHGRHSGTLDQTPARSRRQSC